MTTTRPARVPADAAARLAAMGVHARTVLRDSGKTLTFDATIYGIPVVVKVLITDEAMWARHQRAEQDTYQVAAREGCPLRIPVLRYGDQQITILDRLDGDILHADRYPGPLPPDTVMRVLDHLDLLYTWKPEGLARVPVTDEYVSKHLESGLLRHSDRAAIGSLLWPEQPLRVEHADTHASNFLITADLVGVVDLEHMAWHLAGHDWAMLHLLWGPANPWLADQLLQRAERDRILAGYAANLMLLACREWRIHQDTPDFERLKPVLAANLEAARAHLHRTYASSR